MQSRIDLFLVSHDIASCTTESDILTGYKSDHASIFIKISTMTESRGKGLWRFNTNHLKDINFVQGMNEVIDQTYAEFTDCFAFTLWEMMKLRICEFAIDFTKRKAQENKLLFKQLNQKIENLTRAMQHLPEENVIKDLQIAQGELNDYVEKRAQSTIFRSRAIWYSEGERNSKYFFSLEKANFRYKTVHSLQDEGTNAVIRDEKEILNKCHSFYSTLYDQKSNKKFSLINSFGKTVSNEANETLNAPITVHELGGALREFKNDKAPGCDGAPSGHL